MSPASIAADSINEIATLRIELKDSDPVIWRQVDVPPRSRSRPCTTSSR
jgi:hypothetical protein